MTAWRLALRCHLLHTPEGPHALPAMCASVSFHAWMRGLQTGIVFAWSFLVIAAHSLALSIPFLDTDAVLFAANIPPLTAVTTNAVSPSARAH